MKDLNHQQFQTNNALAQPPPSRRTPQLLALMQYDRMHSHKRRKQWTDNVLRKEIINRDHRQSAHNSFHVEVENLGEHLVSGLDSG